MYGEVEGAPAQTDLYDLVYSPSGHYNVGVDNAEVLPWSQLETVDDQPLAQLNLPQLAPDGISLLAKSTRDLLFN